MFTLTVKISKCKKKRLGIITKAQGRVAAREHLLLNHPLLDHLVLDSNRKIDRYTYIPAL